MALSGHDGYELRVRTDEIKSYREERVNAALTYIGRSIHINADTSQAIWQIKRIITSGAQTYWEWANEGFYTAAWDERASNPSYWPSGIVYDNNFSVNFDGVNDYVTFGTTPFTSMDVGQQWSMSFHVYLNNLSTLKTIYGKTTSDPYGFYIQVDTSGNILVASRAAPSTTLTRTATSGLSALTWYHILVTYSGSGNISGFTIYVDGVAQSATGSGALPVTLHLVGQNATLGARGAVAFYHSGNIDEVSFWSKALSSTEAAELSSLTPASVQNHSAAPTNLTNWWRMGDGDIFPTIVDQVGTVDGTMTNMVSSDIEAFVP